MNETEKKYKQGDRVYFEIGENQPSGWGKVCGVIGPIVIVELKDTIGNYNYTHFYILDAQIKKTWDEQENLIPIA